MELKPADGVLIVETDIQVDFAPALDAAKYEEEAKLAAAARQREIQEQERMLAAAQAARQAKNTPASGEASSSWDIDPAAAVTSTIHADTQQQQSYFSKLSSSGNSLKSSGASTPSSLNTTAPSAPAGNSLSGSGTQAATSSSGEVRTASRIPANSALFARLAANSGPSSSTSLAPPATGTSVASSSASASSPSTTAAPTSPKAFEVKQVCRSDERFDYIYEIRPDGSERLLSRTPKK